VGPTLVAVAIAALCASDSHAVETGRSRGQAALAPGPDAEIASAAMAGLGQTRVLPYPMEFVWPTAVRVLRVDRGYSIVDRDPEAGFILFDFPIGPEDRTGRGSVEIFATKDASGRMAASVQITTDGGPVHLPHALLDALADKLRRERGQPAAPPRPEPTDPPPGGGGKDKDKSKPRPKPTPEPDTRPEDLPILE
jgi:hypothetical protein